MAQRLRQQSGPWRTVACCARPGPTKVHIETDNDVHLAPSGAAVDFFLASRNADFCIRDRDGLGKGNCMNGSGGALAPRHRLDPAGWRRANEALRPRRGAAPIMAAAKVPAGRLAPSAAAPSFQAQHRCSFHRNHTGSESGYQPLQTRLQGVRQHV